MIRILSGIAAEIKTPTGAAVPEILQRFSIAEDPLMMYAVLTSMMVAGVVAGALVEKAKTGTMATSARVTLTYLVLSVSGIAILSLAHLLRLA
jgi:hypothetical protein